MFTRMDLNNYDIMIGSKKSYYQRCGHSEVEAQEAALADTIKEFWTDVFHEHQIPLNHPLGLIVQNTSYIMSQDINKDTSFYNMYDYFTTYFLAFFKVYDKDYQLYNNTAYKVNVNF